MPNNSSIRKSGPCGTRTPTSACKANVLANYTTQPIINVNTVHFLRLIWNTFPLL